MASQGLLPSDSVALEPLPYLGEGNVTNFIDDLLISILDELSKPNGRPSITLKRRLAQATYYLNPNTGALESNGEARTCTYSWPGKTPQEGWRFGIIMRILGLISEAIRGNFISSKRDIFYQDPVYFGSQRLVDGYIDDIAYTAGVDRTALHVAAAAKGLTAGCYKFRLKNQIIIDVEAHIEGISIPLVEDVEQVDLSGVKWILVIEKEAIFHRLATSDFHRTSAAGKGILITGKGYPDLRSRAFLRLLSQRRHSSTLASITSLVPFPPPIYALVDSDPDGMAIMSTYKYGSMAQIHENANLNVSTIEWLGVRTSELLATADTLEKTSFMPLSLRDRKKAQAMLTRSPSFAEDGPEPVWRVELQRMLVMNTKAEIEVLYDLAEGIGGWLDKKLQDMS